MALSLEERPIHTSFMWLPIPKVIKRHARSVVDIGHFGFLRETLHDHERLWNMVELAIPQILRKEYHNFNSTYFINSHGEKHHYLGVAIWYVLWGEAVGISYLNMIVGKHTQYIHAKSNTAKTTDGILTKWRARIDDFLNCILYIRSLSCAPNLEDNCMKAGDFILEPNVLIQLPWHPVILHQWLLASLIEVLLFERESLEFRHWPLPIHILEVAKDLLTVIRRLKERITFGMMSLFQQGTRYPEYSILHPEFMFEQVVLPSLPALKFLISGKAHHIVKNLKKLAWPQTATMEIQKLESGNFMPFSAFYMDINLTTFYVSQCYNYDIWNSNDCPQPFPLQVYDHREILSRLIADKSIFPDYGLLALVFKPYNLEEQNLFEYLEHNQNSKYMKLSPQDRIELTIKTINELVLLPGRIVGVTVEQLRERLDTPTVLKHAQEIFNRNILKQASHLAIGYTMMYWQAYVTLIGSEKEKSALSRVVTLGLEVLEREQVIRLTNACIALFKICPFSIKLDSTPPEPAETLRESISEVSRREQAMNKSTWLSTFPSSWKTSVKINERLPDLSKGVDYVIKTFEERVGRIIYNSSIQSISIGKAGGGPYPNWQAVQYIVPCFFTSFHAVSKQETSDETMRTKNVTNYAKFIHELLRLYETKFDMWRALCVLKKNPDLPEFNDQERTFVSEQRIYALEYIEKLQVYFSFYVNSGVVTQEKECFPGYYMMREAIIKFPNDMPKTGLDPSELHSMLKPWQNAALYLVKDFFVAASAAFRPPFPGFDIPYCPPLGRMYFVDIALRKLTTLFQMNVLYNPADKSNAQQHGKLMMAMCESIDKRKSWKCDLFTYVFDPKVKTPAELTKFVQSHRKGLIEMYNNIKRYRNVLSDTKIQLLNLIIQDVTPNEQEVIRLFIDKNFSALDELLMIPKEKNITKIAKKCRNCEKTETRRHKLTACEQCVKDKYPDVNYFCSRTCKEERWEEEHMAEHLEFDLGLSDFSHLNLDT